MNSILGYYLFFSEQVNSTPDGFPLVLKTLVSIFVAI